jgi:ketosteroid isomerase-like protein
MSPEDKIREANIALVTTYFDRMNSGDPEGAAGLLNDAGTWWSNQRRTIVPMKEFKPGSIKTLHKMPFRQEIHSMLAVDDRVVAETESFATRPDGKPYNNVYCWLFTISQGTILHVREYADTVAAADLPPEIKSLNKH